MAKSLKVWENEFLIYKTYQVKAELIDIGNWAYIIFERKNSKWRKLRSIGYYISHGAARNAALNFIDNNLIKIN